MSLVYRRLPFLPFFANQCLSILYVVSRLSLDLNVICICDQLEIYATEHVMWQLKQVPKSSSRSLILNEHFQLILSENREVGETGMTWIRK